MGHHPKPNQLNVKSKFQAVLDVFPTMEYTKQYDLYYGIFASHTLRPFGGIFLNYTQSRVKTFGI